MDNFCVNCYHCHEKLFPPRPGPEPAYENKWQYLCMTEKTSYVDHVTGRTARRNCKDARAIGGPCGPHGCHFESKS